MTSLQIGKVITAALASNSALVQLVGTKIYPIVAQQGTSFPYIVYRRNSVEPYYTKDGRTGETCTVDIDVASATYTSGIEIADLVRSTIEGKGMTYNDITVRATDLVAADETFQDETYVQTLTFNLTL